jgi:hypothetical protein
VAALVPRQRCAQDRVAGSTAPRATRLVARHSSDESCELCGECAPECLHFHHIDPAKKEITLSAAVANGWARERILAEMAKCRVLCANCHLEHHCDERRL